MSNSNQVAAQPPPTIDVALLPDRLGRIGGKRLQNVGRCLAQ
jgi:hypothetical protein